MQDLLSPLQRLCIATEVRAALMVALHSEIQH